MRRNNNASNKITSWSLIALMSIFLFSYYGSILKNPNAYSFSIKGDGIKNYFVFVSYLKNNKTSFDYTQMNYPYGEGLLFVDAHPLIAYPLNALSKLFPSIPDYGVGILNFMMIFSLMITALLLFRIFNLLKVQPVLGVLSAFSITLLNAQVFRMHGHFSLSYGFFIPLIIYYLLKIELKKATKKRLILLGLWTTAYYFIHAYAGLIASTLILVYGGLRLIGNLIQRKKVKKPLSLLLSGVLPLLSYYIIAKVSDSHTGRTTNPWGLFEYHADLSTVFLPILGPFNNLKHTLFGAVHQTEEGWAYVGVITIIGLIILMIASLVYMIKNKTISFHRGLLKESSLRLLFLTSIVILLISMLIPIRWGMEFIVDWVPLIKQFRSMGRFAMVFYFGATIMLIAMTDALFGKLVKSKKKGLAYFLIALVPGMLYYESIAIQKDMAYNVTRGKNQFALENTSEEFQGALTILSRRSYQAILPLPFFCVGSENFGIYGNLETHELAFLSSYHLGIPLLANMSARSSIWESKNKMQLMSSSFYDKKHEASITSEEPFLVCYTKQEIHANGYKILEKASKIYEGENFIFYEITPKDFFRSTKQEEWDQYAKIKERLFDREGFQVSDTSLFFRFNDLGQKSPISFSDSSGSLETKQKVFTVLFEIGKGELTTGRNYKARFWMYNGGENYGQDKLAGVAFFQKKDESGGAWINLTAPKESFEIKENWSLIELSLEHKSKEASYRLLYKGGEKSKEKVYFKDVLLFDTELKIYKTYEAKEGKVLFKNNHRIDFPKKLN